MSTLYKPQRSYNPTARGLAEAIEVLSDIVHSPLKVSRTRYGYHISTLDGVTIIPPCPGTVDLYDEVLCANII